MIDYIIKSTLCLSILIVVYHLFLEHEKMHLFNRVYLLFSLVYGLTVPLLDLSIENIPAPAAQLLQGGEVALQSATGDSDSLLASTPVIGWATILVIIYSAGVGILLVRFALNLSAILGRVRKARIIPSAGVNIVLVKDQVVPHSFFKYLFLSEEAYISNQIPPVVVAHELTHLRQKHSFDICLLNSSKLYFGITPCLSFTKKLFS